MDLETPMPPLYRATLLRLLADQVRAERMGSDLYSSWIRRAPGPKERLYLATLARDETEHWYRAIGLLEELGVGLEQMRHHQSRHSYYLFSRLLIGRMTWIDILLFSFVMDHGGFYLLEDCTQSSYAPWARMAREIMQDEISHPEMGSQFLRLAIQRQGLGPVQRRLGKWWRVALNMFGPTKAQNTELYIRLGFKFRSNEERRRAFRESCEPRIREIGLKVPRLYHQTYPFF